MEVDDKVEGYSPFSRRPSTLVNWASPRGASRPATRTQPPLGARRSPRCILKDASTTENNPTTGAPTPPLGDCGPRPHVKSLPEGTKSEATAIAYQSLITPSLADTAWTFRSSSATKTDADPRQIENWTSLPWTKALQRHSTSAQRREMGRNPQSNPRIRLSSHCAWELLKGTLESNGNSL